MKTIKALILSLTIALFYACSTTSGVPDNDKLYIGIDKIKYSERQNDEHTLLTKEEVDAALACEPNGALFGSSSYRTPFPYALWIWNAFSKKDTKFSKWMTKSFGKAPVLMSWVNPELRSSVAQSVLYSHGFFDGKVTHEIIDTSNPKKAKIKYNVELGDLFLIDTLEYINFPQEAMRLIDSTYSERKIKSGDAFDVSTLEEERQRVTSLMRSNGYYYYQSGYASYLADTIAKPKHVQLKLQLADSLPERALHKWYIGKLDVNIRRSFMEKLNDSVKRRRFTIHFNGSRPPVRARVIMKDVKLRTKQPYSYDKYVESANKLSANGLFSMVDFKFTPRDSSELCDTLDLMLTCVLDKPYDFYVEADVKGKTNGYIGPGLTLGLTKRNAFRGGEKLDFNLYGNYEWQTGHDIEGSSTGVNSYEYGASVAIDFPRLFIPRIRRYRFFTTPSTIVKGSMNIVNRAKYFRRHVISGEFTYNFQTSATSKHSFSPLVLEYDYMNKMTDKFREILEQSPYLKVAMMDVLIPKMRYTYSYSSPQRYRNPIYWETTISESANITSAVGALFGNKWNEKDKKIFKNPYAQYIKIESDLRKTWTLSEHSQVVGHLNAGIVYSFGNSESVPYIEQFYVGGANSIRAFNVRTIGPGGFVNQNRRFSYMDQTGDVKFVANLEYRTRLFGNLNGAVFIDMGNVWTVHKDDYRNDTQLKFSKVFDQLAIGTGIGLRYDLDYFVLRLDWGFGLHLPYDTGKSGFYNIPSFRDGQSIHLAIGYPF